MKRLYRSRQNRVLGGVCGGLADYLSADPAVVRLAWVAFSLLGGAGVLLYLIAWIIVPEEYGEVVERPRAPTGPSPEPGEERVRVREHGEMSHPGRTRLFGIILIVAGAYFLVVRLIPVRISLWPVLLVALGVALLLSAGGSGDPRGGSREVPQAPLQRAEEEPEDTPGKGEGG